jgi:pyruvate,water dikinase
MLDPAIPRSGPRSMDARGFAHVVLQHAFANLEEDYTLSDPCYAIVSSNYVNVASRVGFHFSAVDTYCSQFQDQNYITFRFKGGAADMIRRMRRIEAIGRILRSLGFTADVIGDLVTARYDKHDEQDTLGTIEMIGRLLQFMRQMDAAMTSDAVIDSVVDGFLAGRYRADAS